MNDVLTYTEVQATFDGEWVLIDDPVTDKNNQVLSGKVLCHSKDKDLVHRKALEVKPPRRLAIFYVGKLPKDVGYWLTPFHLDNQRAGEPGASATGEQVSPSGR